MTTKVSDERLRELIRWDERTCIDKVPGGFAFDHIAALRELQEKRAQEKVAEALCKMYFDIAAEAIGEEEVRKRRDALLARVRGET